MLCEANGMALWPMETEVASGKEGERVDLRGSPARAVSYAERSLSAATWHLTFDKTGMHSAKMTELPGAKEGRATEDKDQAWEAGF